MNRSNDNTGANINNKGNNQSRGQAPMEPRPLLTNTPLPHQFQMQNLYGNATLRGGNSFLPGLPVNAMNNLLPPQMMPMPRMEFPTNQPFDFQSLLQFGQQMQLLGNNDFDGNLGNNSGNSNSDSHRNQSKMMHRHENRSHNQNQNYSRDKDRRNDRRRDRSRSRERSRPKDDWMRNRGNDNRRNERNDRGSKNRRR